MAMSLTHILKIINHLKQKFLLKEELDRVTKLGAGGLIYASLGTYKEVFETQIQQEQSRCYSLL